MARLITLAKSPLRALPAIERDDLDDRIDLMLTLPRQKIEGEVAGALKFESYHVVLGNLPLVQIDWMVREVLRTCEWMPSPAQCLKIAERWQRSDVATQARALAEGKVRREHQARLDENRHRLQRERCEQDWIDALPDRHREVFEVEGLLWRCECGSYAQRSQWRDVMPTATKDPLADVAERFPSQRDKEAA